MKTEENGAVVLWLLVAAVVVALAGDGYLGWQYSKLHNDNKSLTSQKLALQAQLQQSRNQLNQLSAAQTTNSTNSQVSSETKVNIPQSLVDNIQAALNTMNTGALEGYMAPQVNVVFAASDKTGGRTPAQAVSDLDYLKNATQPWDFNLGASVLSSYGKGSYGRYFGTNTVVGKSTNAYVASFHINSNVKIDTIFISASEDLLK